jgi:hypothetical protein
MLALGYWHTDPPGRLLGLKSTFGSRSMGLEHFPDWYPTHFRKKRGNGWGTGVYSKSEML